MKCRTAVILFLVTLFAAMPAAATVSWYTEIDGASKTYYYNYTNTEEAGDWIVGFHIFAPVDASLVSAGAADPGWDFATAVDASGALDIYWACNDPDAYALGPNDSLQVSIVTHSSVATAYDYVLPDFEIGNWGYDGQYSGGTWTMFGSVPVPRGTGDVIPEPTSITALAAGIALLARMRRRIR